MILCVHMFAAGSEVTYVPKKENLDVSCREFLRNVIYKFQA